MKEKTIGLSELQTEKTKLENDRAVLSERLQALNTEREKTQQQLIMTSGALQTVNHFIERTDPEKQVEADLNSNETINQTEPGP